MNSSSALAAVLALAVPASAQPFGMSEELGAAVMNVRKLKADAPQALQAARAAAAADAPPAFAAINTGFRALGAAGKTGTVGGPGPLGAGDGTYRVIQNDPMQMVFTMKTGYVDGRFTLSRDPATGKDTLGFTGQTKDGPFSGWTPGSGNYAGQISYNPASDSGTISWRLDGAQVNDTYRGGRAGSRSMTITLKGNVHTFTQD